MNPRRSSFRRKIIYLVVIVLLLVPIVLISAPATTSETGGAQGSPGGYLARLRSENQLAAAQLGRIDPTSETLKLVTLGMRGIAATQLWTQAHEYKKKKDWTNLRATVDQLKEIQPNFVAVWRFQAWNLSYNVSVEFDDYRDRYHWVIEGIHFLDDGIAYNRLEPILLWDKGWFVAQKLGRADEHKQFRRLFRNDDDYHGDRPLAERDNWLVGRQSFIDAVRLVDTHNVRLRGTRLEDGKGLSPLIYRSDPAMCLMNYAEALETLDGQFGEVAEFAWRDAGKAWHDYGSEDIPSSYGPVIQLNDLERYRREAKELTEQLTELAPGAREQLTEEKQATLTDAEREALATPFLDRSAKQHDLVGKASEKLRVTYEEVAERAPRADRSRALAIAKKITEDENLAGIIDNYRGIINFEYWRLRAEVEQQELTRKAREHLYKAENARVQAELDPAYAEFNAGFQAWRQVLDKYPTLLDDKTTGDDLTTAIKQYRRLLDSRDETFPDNFVLQDVLEHWPDEK